MFIDKRYTKARLNKYTLAKIFFAVLVVRRNNFVNGFYLLAAIC